MSKGRDRKPGVSRRTFLQQAVAGAGATAAAATRRERRPPRRSRRRTPRAAVAAIRIPAEFAAGASAAPPVPFDFPMTGAQVFARACKEEGVAALFCCPGNYAVVHAIAVDRHPGLRRPPRRIDGARRRRVHPRHRRDRRRRSGTEGPGFTDMICAIACANAARTPLLVVASNMSIAQEDTEAGIQLGYQQPTTEGLKKYGKRLIIPRRVHEYAGYAFRQLKSGVPGPVHLDFPAEVASARFKDADRARVLPRQVALPHRLAAASVAEGHRQGRRPDQDRAAADHRVEQRRVLREGVGRAEALRREGADSGRRVRRDEGPVLRREPAVGQRRARRAGERRPRDPRRPALHADRRRVRVRARRANTSASIRRTKTSAGTCRSISASSAASWRRSKRWPTRCRAMTHDAWVAEIAAARKQFEDQNDEYYKIGLGYTRCRASGGDREGARRFPLSRQAAEGADDDRVRRLRHRALRAPRAARLPSRTDHERRVSVRRDRSGRRLRRRRRRGGAARRRAAGRATRAIRSSA